MAIFNPKVNLQAQVLALKTTFEKSGVKADFLMLGKTELKEFDKFYEAEAKKKKPCKTLSEYKTSRKVLGCEIVETYHDADFYIV